VIRSLLRPTFFIPSFFLILFVGTVAMLEYKLDVEQDTMMDILNDPIGTYGDAFSSSLWTFKLNLDTVRNSSVSSGLKIDLADDLEKASTELAKIEFYANQKSGNDIVENFGFSKVTAIRHDISELRDSLAQCRTNDTACLVPIDRQTTQLVTDSKSLNDETDHYRDKSLKKILNTIINEEFLRESSLAMTLVILFGLTGYSLKMARRHEIEKHRAQESEQQNALFGAIVQSSEIGVLVRDMLRPGIPVVYINKAFTKLTGYTLDEIRHRDIGFLLGIHTNLDEAKKFRGAFEKLESLASSLLLYRKDSTPFWSECFIAPVHQNDRRVSHYFALITDISTIYATQESLRLAKEAAERAGKVKANFLASMSHEIRTPINGVLGVLELLSDTRLDQEQNKLVRIATSSGKHLLSIINDVLDYSKIEAGKYEIVSEPFSLRDTVREATEIVRPIARAKDLRLEVEIAAEIADGYVGDGGRIKQILINLMSNAVKFTEQGQVTLKIFKLMDQADDDRQTALLRFEILDTGIGISLEDQGKLFEEFSQVDGNFTRRFGGTGLGLAITKQLVRLLNGEIGLESHLGKGSRFWFFLPLRRDMRTSLPPSCDESAPVNVLETNPQHRSLARNTGELRILLVEDNPVNQLVALRYLNKAGFQSELAINGREAVEKAASRNFDAILMDISMPEMDGIAATKHIRAMGGSHASIPIIAVTAHVMRGDREQCMAAGMNDYLCKPLHYDSLCKVLARWIPNFSYGEKVANPGDQAIASPSPSIFIFDEMPLFDPAVLERLAKDLDPEIVLKITHVFTEDFVKRFAALQGHIAAKNWHEVARGAHTLKSSSGGCGLVRFAAIMERLEFAANKEDEAQIKELTEKIQLIYESSREALANGRSKFETKDG
jgi:PAS domain S-box-containing protein